MKIPSGDVTTEALPQNLLQMIISSPALASQRAAFTHTHTSDVPIGELVIPLDWESIRHFLAPQGYHI